MPSPEKGKESTRRKPHHTDAAKEKFLYALKVIKDFDLPISQRALARHAGIPESTARRFIAESEKTPTDEDYGLENRGRKMLLSQQEIDNIEKVLYDGGHEVRRLPFDELPQAAGIGHFTGHKRTIMRMIGHKDWRKCIKCDRGWTQKDHAEARYAASKDALQQRPRPEDWWSVRWADEAHFTFGGDDFDKMIRKDGELECPDCLLPPAPTGTGAPTLKDTAKNDGEKEGEAEGEDGEGAESAAPKYRKRPQVARLHAWAAIGHDFKSELIWYTSVGAMSQAITQNAYMDDILTKQVKKWIRKGDKFVLEEDRARQHILNQSVVKQWGETYKLKAHCSTTRSPDLSPIEEAWKVPREYLKEHVIWDEAELKDAATQGWEAVTQGQINAWVDSMPERHRAVVEQGGYIRARDPHQLPFVHPPPQQRPQPQLQMGGMPAGNPFPSIRHPLAASVSQPQQLNMPGVSVYPPLDQSLSQLYTSNNFMSEESYRGP